MKIDIPARFVDKNHTAVITEVEADLEDGRMTVAIRLNFHGAMFEMTRISKDGTLIYHQQMPKPIQRTIQEDLKKFQKKD